MKISRKPDSPSARQETLHPVWSNGVVMVLVRFHNCFHLSVPDGSSSLVDVPHLPTLIASSLAGLFHGSNSSCSAFRRILSHLSSLLGLFSMTIVTPLPESALLTTNTATDVLFWSCTWCYRVLCYVGAMGNCYQTTMCQNEEHHDL